MIDELEHLTRDELYQRLVELKSKVKYGLVWEDKPEEVQQMCETNYPVLTEIAEKEVKTQEQGDKNTEKKDCSIPNLNHILIEGDNYHALQTLNYTHQGKIDVIYIDPPYNTGNKDFTYNDRYIDKEDVFRHSTWLSFMSKRLELARNLLSEKGVIFMSIDDNEQAQLKLLCDSIFGEENWLETFIWKTEGNIDNQRKIKSNHEYIHLFAKNEKLFEPPVVIDPNIEETSKLYNDEIENSITKNGPKNPESEIIVPKGFPCTFESGVILKRNDKYPNISSDLIVKNYKTTNEVIFKSGWSSKSLLEKFISNDFDEIIDIKQQETRFSITNTGAIYCYKKRSNQQSHVLSVLTNFGTTKKTSEYLKSFEVDFTFPKPIDLIKYILKFSKPNSVILDFMAGSGTTGQAVLELNREDGGHRQFILCTNNELNGVGSQLARDTRPKAMTDMEFDIWREQFGICQRVTHPRLQKVMSGYTNSKGVEVTGLGGNLRYFQTSFVPKTLSRDQNTENMVSKCTEMLCLKENVFDIVKTTGNYKIFHSGSKTLGVYYSPSTSYIHEFCQEMRRYKGEKILYCFALDYEVDEEVFDEVSGMDDIRVEPIPEKILDMYDQISKYSKL